MFNKNVEQKLELLGSLMAFLVIGGFGLYRLILGDIAVAITDIFIALALLFLHVQIWRDNKSEILNCLIVFTYSAGVIILIAIKGNSVFFWLYPAIAGTFFLLNLKPAVIANVTFISASVLILYQMNNLEGLLNIYGALILSFVFSYIFSARSEHHKKQLSLLATQGPLTQVGNRRSFDERIKAELQTFNRSVQPSSILIFDLDHFKKVNDVYGHSAGDEVLVDFVNILKSSVRVTDAIYRYGGEEFVIVASNVSLESAGKFAEHIRELVEENLKVEQQGVTTSIGVSQLIAGDTDESWFKRADSALYQAKNTSRNSVCLATIDKKIKTCSYRPFKEIEKDQIDEISKTLKLVANKTADGAKETSQNCV